MTQFWSYMYDASYTDVLPIQHHRSLEILICILVILKNHKNTKKNNLHSTFTLTVWLTGVPTPLWAVHRYVPFALLWILLRTYFPSTTGSRGALSLPLSSTFVQVMVGVGLPVALQLKVTKDPSQTTWSLLTLAISGGTAKIVLNSYSYLECRKHFSNIYLACIADVI